MDAFADHDLHEMINDLPHTIVTPASYTTTYTITTTLTTTTTTTPLNRGPSYNNQMLNEWSLNAMVNGFPLTNDASMPSFTTNSSITAFTPTTTIPATNNQILGDWELDVIDNGFYATPNESSSAAATTVASPTPTAFAPTIINTPLMHDPSLDSWGPHAMANQFCSNIVPSPSSSIVRNTTSVPTPLTTPGVNNQNSDDAYHWKQHTMANIVGSSSSFFGATTTITNAPTNVEHQQKSSFQGDRRKPYQPVKKNTNNIMQNSDNPPKAPPLSSKNWPILTIPFLGKLTHKPPQQNLAQESLNISKRTEIICSQRQQHSLDISKCTKVNAQSPSHSNERKREKRIYKMPFEAVKNDVWSWRKYGEKSVDGSPFPRVYYKCNSSKECAAKRRVEQNRADPEFAILKYSGRHNHPMPTFMNPTNNNSTSSYKATSKDDHMHF